MIVGDYTIMPDHIHLFVWLNHNSCGLKRWIKGLKRALSEKLNCRQIKLPHWQESFFDHLIRNGESYIDKCEYVRLNPVRAGLVEKPEDWPYNGKIFTLFEGTFIDF